MRVTNTLFFNTSTTEHQSAMKKLYDIDKQIASKLKIQNSFEDSGVYVDTMRLNYEIATLEQGIESSSKAQKFAQNTDSTLNQFSTSLEQFKTKLIQANSAANSTTSLNALANELEALKDHMIALGNTSINGQFLFSGTSLTQKPLSSDGSYEGNGESLTSIIGASVELPYNIDGKSLFLGTDSDYNRIVSTNVKMYDETSTETTKPYLTSTDTIQKMIGTTTNTPQTVFYLSGRKSDGDTFAQTIAMDITSPVSDLLEDIGNAYGNTSTNKVVDVTMNKFGQIELKDLTTGNQLIEMNLFGAVDTSAVIGTGDALQSDIDDLALHSNVKIISFNKSNFSSASLTPAIEDGMNYTRRGFEKEGNELRGNISQVIKGTNEYAKASTKLLAVAGTSSLDTTNLTLSGTDKNGNAFDVTIDLSTSGSTFTINGGTPFSIFNATGTNTAAEDVTYQQLMDVVSMATAGVEPTTNTFNDYKQALQDASASVEVSLDYQGKMVIKDKTSSQSTIEFSMYDDNADQASGTGTALSFMANDSVAISNPTIDFFKNLDEMIYAVRNGTFSMDSTNSNPRNMGINNALSWIDHIADHVTKEHTKIGTYTNALQDANDRAEYLSLNVKTVRSEIVDVDIAEAYLQFNQISNSYQAMLSTISKINSMSLLNYM